MNKKILRVLLLSVCALVFSTHPSEAEEPVTIYYEVNTPPLAYLRDGKPAGFYPALLAAAFVRMGQPLVLEARPFKRLVVEMDACHGGAVAIYKTEARLKKIDFSTPIALDNMAVYFNGAHPLKFNGLDDLYGKTVGVRRGWLIAEDFQAARKEGKFQVEETDTDDSNFLKLARGRIDAVLTLDQLGDVKLGRGEYPNIEKASVFLSSHTTHLVFCKAAQQTVLLERFNKILADMRKDGSYDRLLRQEVQ